MKKTSKQKAVVKSASPGLEKTLQDIQHISDELSSHLKQLKKRYSKLDQKTKKRVVTGLAATAALIAGAKIAKKVSNRKK